jgi:NADP-dependent 3-hydroxy acid dehydrogenase YdfG
MGAKVATCGRSHDKLYQLQASHPSSALHTMVADVSNENDCRRLMETTIKMFGGIDVLINNAGISMRAILQEASTEVFKKVMDINYFGVIYCTKYALDSIIERKGTIVGVSSIAGYRGLPGRSGYSASKFALTRLAGVHQNRAHDPGGACDVGLPWFHDLQYPQRCPE